MALRGKSLLLVLLLAILAQPVQAGQDPAPPEAPEPDQATPRVVTVGAVLSNLAHALNPELPATIPPAEALTFLRSSGLALPGEVDLTAPLNAVRAATLLAAAGVRVHSDSEDSEAPLPGTMLSPLVEILHLALTGPGQS